VLVIDENGASTVDLDIGSTATIPAPAGGNFGEIAGGATFGATDGSQYIVGGTRLTGGTTPRILFVNPTGDLTFAALATPREDGCATWVDGRGLVIVGGAPAARAPRSSRRPRRRRRRSPIRRTRFEGAPRRPSTRPTSSSPAGPTRTAASARRT